MIVVVCGFSSKEDVPYIVNFGKRFVPIDKNLYTDKYELTTKDYQLFLKEKKEAGTDYSLLIYDSTLWRNKLYDEPMVELYFWYPAFRDYPVVCISHYAAEEFCKWLTEKYEATPKKKFKKVVFRLPTESEFTKAAISIYDSTKIFYPWGHNSLFDRKDKYSYCNHSISREKYWIYNDSTKRYEIIHNDIFKSAKAFPTSVKYYKPNPYGLYNMVGNVSEMVQEAGVAMGGDWCSAGENVKVTSKKKYENGGHRTVGFRVYMEIIEF